MLFIAFLGCTNGASFSFVSQKKTAAFPLRLMQSHAKKKSKDREKGRGQHGFHHQVLRWDKSYDLLFTFCHVADLSWVIQS